MVWHKFYLGNHADHPGAREIKETIHGCNKGKLVDECEGRSDAVLVVRIEREIGWCKLRDCDRYRGLLNPSP